MRSSRFWLGAVLLTIAVSFSFWRQNSVKNLTTSKYSVVIQQAERTEGLSICGLQVGSTLDDTAKSLKADFHLIREPNCYPAVENKAGEVIFQLGSSVADRDSITRIIASNLSSVEYKGKPLFYPTSDHDLIIKEMKKFKSFKQWQSFPYVHLSISEGDVFLSVVFFHGSSDSNSLSQVELFKAGAGK